MSYLNEFHKKVDNKDFMGLLQMWEEYCTCDEVDGVELKKILELIKGSDYATKFGQYAESILPLWKAMDEEKLSQDVFELIIDLQTTQSTILADLTLEFLKQRYGNQQYFNEKIRLIGLRTRENFQGAVRNYNLLTHMEVGTFVFHTAGWGTGEIMSLSLIREELAIEFENVLGVKQVSFENAFNTLISLEKDHFLSQRFGNPDALEALAKKDAVGVIHKLLSDLGPKTAAEIKDEVCELVIPKTDWSSWWQSTRNKLKKDKNIDTPSSIHEPFRLHDQELAHDERFKRDFIKKTTLRQKIIATYNYLRDFSETLRNEETKIYFKELVDELLSEEGISDSDRFQLQILGLETHPENTFDAHIHSFIENLEDPLSLINDIDIASIKKKVLIYIRQIRPDWMNDFASLLLTVDQNILKEYLYKELHTGANSVLIDRLNELYEQGKDFPDAVFWYFQKIMQDSSLPFSDIEGRCRFLECYLTTLHHIERHTGWNSLAKKMSQYLTQKRFAILRKVIEGTSLEFLREFLLLASKCQSFTTQDIKIMHSLAKVVCPEISGLTEHAEEDDEEEEEIFWTTQVSLQRVKEKLNHMSTVEMIDVAQEIEAARAHGDLKENSEYKYAQERRARLQSEIKRLSAQVDRAQIITSNDVDTSQASIGTLIHLEGPNEVKDSYTILGPWDADTENNIISFHSKLAQSIEGKKIGETVSIQGNDLTVKSIECAI